MKHKTIHERTEFMNISVLLPDNDVRKMFIPSNVAKALENLGTVRWNKKEYEPENMIDLLKDCEVCVTGWGNPRLDETLLANAKSLRLVVHSGGTVAPLVSDYLYDMGAKVVSGNDVFAEGVAEGTMAYILAGLRLIPYYNSMVQAGNWKTNFCPNYSLLEKKVGLVGFGAIARYLTRMLHAFRTDIRVYDPYVDADAMKTYGVTKAESLDALFSECEIISLHLAQQPETYRLINKDLIKRMQDGALFVNTARGSTVDEAALAEELATGRISAILDVFDTEPLPKDSKLRGLDNVILIPHMAGPPSDRFDKVVLTLIEDVKRLWAGEELRNEISRGYAFKMTT